MVVFRNIGDARKSGKVKWIFGLGVEFLPDNTPIRIKGDEVIGPASYGDGEQVLGRLNVRD